MTDARVIDLDARRTLPCPLCLCDIPRRDFDQHRHDCDVLRSKRLHPSNRP